MNLLLPALVTSGRRVVSGSLTAPSLSSVDKGWHGVMLECFRGGSSDFTAVLENHGVMLQLEGCTRWFQRFEGKGLHTETRPGGVIVSPAGASKTFQHEGSGSFLVVHLAPTLLQRIAEEVQPKGSASFEIINNPGTRDLRIERLALQLWEEYRTDDPTSGLYAEALALQLAIHLLRHHSNLKRVDEPRSVQLSKSDLKRAVAYIDANIAEALTIRDIAQALDMSASHFTRAFRASTGVPPHRFLLERRMELAKNLLSRTRLPISQIAMRAGFATHAHFCVAFHQRTGATPSTYRSTTTAGGVPDDCENRPDTGS